MSAVPSHAAASPAPRWSHPPHTNHRGNSWQGPAGRRWRGMTGSYTACMCAHSMTLSGARHGQCRQGGGASQRAHQEGGFLARAPHRRGRARAARSTDTNATPRAARRPARRAGGALAASGARVQGAAPRGACTRRARARGAGSGPGPGAGPPQTRTAGRGAGPLRGLVGDGHARCVGLEVLLRLRLEHDLLELIAVNVLLRGVIRGDEGGSGGDEVRGWGWAGEGVGVGRGVKGWFKPRSPTPGPHASVDSQPRAPPPRAPSR